MSYFAPYIDSTGIHVPDYTTIRDYLIEQFKIIFGQDLYLGADCQDYQMISLFADVIDDANALAIEAFNNRNPDYARGNALDMILPLNGIIRMGATHSEVVLTLSGTSGTAISAGSVAIDIYGNRWIVQELSTIGEAGNTTANARAETSGYISAGVGVITQIGTPTSGWVSVTNLSEAIPGRNEETDAEARARRLESIENSAVSVLQSLIGSLYEIDGVTKLRVYENATGAVDSNGIPAHSICAIVEGGNSSDIAEMIYNKKSPGCGLYGDVTVSVDDAFGSTMDISFMRPTEQDVEVAITIKAFPGYTTNLTDEIKSSVADYINTLEIGETLQTGLLWAVILGENPSIEGAVFSPSSVQIALLGGVLGEAPIVPAFDEVFACDIADIVITIT